MSGWRQWSIGELVEFDDFQSFLQDQVVQVYADDAARTTALGTAVAEGMVAYLKDTNAVEVYTTEWVSIATGDITGVTAGTGLTGGGVSGDVTLDVNIPAVGSAISITAAQISDVTATAAELNHLDGVTSAVQTQLDERVLKTNGFVTTAATGSAVVRNVSFATATPGTADGMDGDVWLVYTP